MDKKDINSPEFLARLRAGDPDAYVELWRFIWTLLRPRYYKLQLQEFAEDLCSTTILKLFRTRCAGYDPARSCFSTWVITVGWRDALDEWRRRRLHPEVPLDTVDQELFIAVSSDENISGRQELKEKVKRAFAALGETDREILSLRAIDDLPFDLIAEVLDITEANARVRYSRALGHLFLAIERLGPSGLSRRHRRPQRGDSHRTPSAPHYP